MKAKSDKRFFVTTIVTVSTFVDLKMHLQYSTFVQSSSPVHPLIRYCPSRTINCVMILYWPIKGVGCVHVECTVYSLTNQYDLCLTCTCMYMNFVVIFPGTCICMYMYMYFKLRY